MISVVEKCVYVVVEIFYLRVSFYGYNLELKLMIFEEYVMDKMGKILLKVFGINCYWMDLELMGVKR